jgi:LmbE family N-acetylglucosaminyl deacetylase
MRILVISPHADDETIGMGGTIAKYASGGAAVAVAVMTGHGEDADHPIWPRSNWDTVRRELRHACNVLGVAEILFEEIPAVAVADQPVWKLNSLTRRVIERVAPEILYVPFPLDLHKDHRELFHSFSVHWRPYLPLGHAIREVYTYEVLSETHLNMPYVEQAFVPNRWVDISGFIDLKMKALACYESQMQPHPAARSLEAVRALATWRGASIGVAAAEAFVMVRQLA